MSTDRVWSERSAAYAVSATHRTSETLAALLALLRPGPDDRCLDIGTGAGHTAARLAEVAGSVTGLDPADGMLDTARALYGASGNLRFVKGSGADSGQASGTFDVVTARHTLHHHPDPLATLREVARLLRPGGRLGFVDEITPSPEVEAWYHALEVARDPSHLRAYRLDGWRSMVRAAGLRWIVGDGWGYEKIEVDDWIARLAPAPAAEAEVRRLFRCADGAARAAFRIRYDAAGEATRFDMPVAIVLAVKEE